MPALSAQRPGRCPRCVLPPTACVCSDIPRLETRTRVVLIRHWREAHATTNTGRLAALALPRMEIHDHGAPSLPPVTAADLDLPADPTRAWLLFPPEEGHPPPAADAPLPEVLVVLDGSWRHARRMVRRLEAVQALPRFSPPPSQVVRHRLRTPTFPGGMATLEAIAQALAVLEADPAVGQRLDDLFELFVERVRALGGR